MSNELGCKELTELITEYLEQTLAVDDQKRFEEHVAICEGCVTYIEQMRETVNQAGRVGRLEIPSDVEADLLAAFRTWKGTR